MALGSLHNVSSHGTVYGVGLALPRIFKFWKNSVETRQNLNFPGGILNDTFVALIGSQNFSYSPRDVISHWSLALHS